MTTQTLLVNRNDFAEVALVNADETPLQAGSVRVKIGPWALTANNITYMVTGDQIGYWHYFEPSHYDLLIEEGEDIRWGRMPVWGYAEVTESLCEDVPVGTQIYGFFPVAETMDLKPIKINPNGFQDGTEHRLELHSVYNSYSFTKSDPSFQAYETLQPILRPLFTTSFLIDDFLDREAFYGAEQVLILSASSKTALGTAYCLKQRGGIRVAGLTSERNQSFVEGTKNNHGAAPVMFFAPDQAKQRFKDWGADGFAKNLGARWMPFCESANDWLSIEIKTGIEPVLKTYKDLLDGKTDPAKATLFSL